MYDTHFTFVDSVARDAVAKDAWEADPRPSGVFRYMGWLSSSGSKRR